MRILVTGVAGFIGFHTAQKLLARGDTVVGVDSLTPYYDVTLKKARLKLLEGKGFTFVQADITDKDTIKRLLVAHEIQCICHLAAQAGVRYSLTDPFAYEHSNNQGTLVLLELCKEIGIKKFVFASSSSVYGASKDLPFKEDTRTHTQISLYAATKKYNEVLAHAYSHLYGINCIGLRFFTVYGPYGRPDLSLFKFVKNTLEGKPIELYNNGNHRRDFTYVDDITDGVVAAIDADYQYEIFNLGRGETVDLLTFVKIIEEELGMETKKILVPMQAGDVEETSADITKARKMLGFEPKTSIREGTRNFIDWYCAYYGHEHPKKAKEKHATSKK